MKYGISFRFKDIRIKTTCKSSVAKEDMVVNIRFPGFCYNEMRSLRKECEGRTCVFSFGSWKSYLFK